MKLPKRPTRDPLPPDHGARVLAHYLTLGLFLAILVVLASTPPPVTEPAIPIGQAEAPGFWSNLARLVGKLL